MTVRYQIPSDAQKIKMLVGDVNDGDFQKIIAEFDIAKPQNNNPIWESPLPGADVAKGKKLMMLATIQENNPHSEWGSVYLYINDNDDPEEPVEGENKFRIEDDEIVYVQNHIEFV